MKALCLIIAVLAALHGAMVIAEYGFGRPGFLELRALFDMNREENIPTLFSSLQLLLAAFLLALIALESRASNRGDWLQWLGLSAVFSFLAVDEFCELHEQLFGRLHKLLHTDGALSFAWVIPYSVLVAIFAASYARFWWRLAPRSRLLFAVSAAIFVGAGIGLEMVGSKLFTLYGWKSVQFDSQTLVEESLEMFGVALFIFSLAEILQQRVGTFTLTLSDQPEGAVTFASAGRPEKAVAEAG